MARVTVYAVRNADTKERMTYRHRTVRDARAAMKFLSHHKDAPNMEIYRTTQNLWRA